MYDWFKIELMNRPAAELRQKLDFIKPVNMKTGEILGTYEVSYLRVHGEQDSAISVKIFPSGRVWVQGSIHKFWHGQNHSIFTFSEMQKAFAFLFSKLGTKPENGRFIQLEIALNVFPDYNADEIIKRLICFKYKPFDGLGNYTKIGKVCFQSESDLKIYNKAKQYSLKQNILRVEKKFKESRGLKKLGISTVSDLTKGNTEKLLSDLLSSFDEVLINDMSIDETKLTTRQKIALAKYRNANYWIEQSRAERLNSKNRFKNLITKHGTEKYLNTVKILLQKQVQNVIGNIDIFGNN